MHSFLGMASWYRRFIPNFTEKAVALQNLTRKGQKFEWNPEHQASFTILKQSLTSAPVLACPDFSHGAVGDRVWNSHGPARPDEALLEGAASDWWNTTPTRIKSWAGLTTELLKYYLPPRYEEQVEMQITQLRQRESEPVREYAMSLRKLKQFTKLSEEQKLDRIYQNCRSKIKLYTRRTGFETLTQFLKLAEEVEEIEAS
ncbi:uncharacterized protein LOC122756597 [Drosophila santomea]|uniref:uncharacterized protein LOC122756596 n=1 Tax=Drosophila santomea TaxID=129105 RepID=UPI001CCFE841|nr:uncharacterized protein LOC122756596 [Drosophila santomea]XP_043862622.1 uncharacterized protein LOC122756597 [Drosophila santomea]